MALHESCLRSVELRSQCAMISKNGRIHMASYEWKDGRFHNVIDLPENYEVRDFSTGDYLPSKSEFDVGKYDEIRIKGSQGVRKINFETWNCFQPKYTVNAI